jgi:hypothetical protein
MSDIQGEKQGEGDSPFTLFHDLMAWKVTRLLLVSTPYDAWVLEADCRLSERIISEYRGLNLSRPPRLTWVGSAAEALHKLERNPFDMVLTMSHLADMAPDELGRKIKAGAPDLPVILLSHRTAPGPAAAEAGIDREGIDGAFVWSGDTDIVVALIKSTEDRVNVDQDTRLAGIRVILLVQNSPQLLSRLLPILYREVVSQTQSLFRSGLNEEERLLTMRARPKILTAGTYEEAMALFHRFEPYVLGVISDVDVTRQDPAGERAGAEILARIKKERFDIPLLLTGRHPDDALLASETGAVFLDTRSKLLRTEVQDFFKTRLGFGDFIFHRGDGQELGRAGTLRQLADAVENMPIDVIEYHSRRNDFSRWLFARTETELAAKMRPLSAEDFPDIESHRRYLVSMIQDRRRQRNKGVVADFDPLDFDPETEFLKIGKGSLGGKARGLAFLGYLFSDAGPLGQDAGKVSVGIPQTLVITTDGFETFIIENDLGAMPQNSLTDEEIARRFLAARLSDDLTEALRGYLSRIHYPLAVRSSGLLEDAQQHAYAGLYHTYILPNDHENIESRLNHLLQAVKLVYASTFFKSARTYAERVGHRTSDEKMAVIVQRLVGSPYGPYYYPAISGVALSRNYYPQARMKPEDGVAVIALGLGKSVVSGGQSLRFCPKYPKNVPQRGNVDEVLTYCQRHFYALRMGRWPELGVDDGVTLEYRAVNDAVDDPPMRLLASTYLPEDHRIRDTTLIPGRRVLTFSGVLKHNLLPLSSILQHVLAAGEAGMGRPVEMEFAVDLPDDGASPARFMLLQLRPMSARSTSADVSIASREIENALCYTHRAIGNGIDRSLTDIIYVKPDCFDVARTREIARQIAELNSRLARAGRKYLLVGPGRWGSQDPWLGIPVNWGDINGVGAVVETMSKLLKAEPSQGAHFFHNLASLDISYLCVTDRSPDQFDWSWLTAQPIHCQTDGAAHVKLNIPLEIKVDGRTSCGLIRAAATSI